MKRILAIAAVAAAITGAMVAPAAAAGVCLTTSVTVNGTEAPTNGTNCVTLP